MATRFAQSKLAAGLVVAVCLLAGSCRPYTGAGQQATRVSFEIENATASTVEVTIEVTDAEGNPIEATSSSSSSSTSSTATSGTSSTSSTSDTESVSTDSLLGDINSASKAIKPDTLARSARVLRTDATVRVPEYQTSGGELVCGEMIMVTATVVASEATVVLSGSGTGTPGFDEGSVGLAGERYLLSNTDYVCGETIVIRINDDGSAVGASEGTTARGQLAVTEPGEESPFEPITAAAVVTEDTTEDTETEDEAPPEPTTLLVQIENRTSTIARTSVLVGVGSAEGDTFEVTVPPDVVTQGEFTCGAQVTITAVFLNTDRPPNCEAAAVCDPELYPDAIIVLTGDGTGSPGFDEASVGPEGERILVLDDHVSCGDTIAVSILDDSAVVAPEGFNSLGIGAGTVQVISEEGATEDSDGVETSAEPDMSVTIDNQTDEFIRVNIVGGAASLGKQVNVYVPPQLDSSGLLSCGDRYTITAYSLIEGALAGLTEEVLIVLDGDGTGTSGFDSGSVGQIGQRLLQVDTHYSCGDAFSVAVTDPGEPGYTEPDITSNGVVIGFEDLNENGVQDDIPDRLGAGRVDVTSE